MWNKFDGTKSKKENKSSLKCGVRLTKMVIERAHQKHVFNRNTNREEKHKQHSDSNVNDKQNAQKIRT